MYSRVPPPEAVPSSPSVSEEGSGEKGAARPANVSEERWRKFQQLKQRREKECGPSAQQRAETDRMALLKTVCQELSPEDRAVLREEGVALPREPKRRKRRRKISPPPPEEVDKLEQQWDEVKQFMDPNPQLRGCEEGKYAAKCKLMSEMDAAIDQGDLEEAAAMSDKLAQREFASKVATAFDCHKYISQKKAEEKKKQAKRPKLVWRFEHKQRWESKGNM